MLVIVIEVFGSSINIWYRSDSSLGIGTKMESIYYYILVMYRRAVDFLMSKNAISKKKNQ